MIKHCILLLLLLPFIVNISYSQKTNNKTTITGTVVDVNQNPVAGASIVIDGIKTNRITNRKGIYKIKVENSANKIGISIFEETVWEEEINNRQNINFTLSNYDAQQVSHQNSNKDEDEIDIGYGRGKKEDLTRSSSTIDGKNKRYLSYQSIYDMISGELPGVQVIGRNIRIQGASSINSSTEPLFVVDGINVTSIDNIQPHLVKSIEVLKGSAAAIYGSRGANGVILITLVSGDQR